MPCPFRGDQNDVSVSGGVWGRVGGASIDGFAQGFSGLEMGYAFFRNLNAFARSGVAPYAGWAAVDREAAKAANFDAVAFDQRVTHRIEHRLDGQFGVAVGQLRKAGSEFFNQIGAGHGVNL